MRFQRLHTYVLDMALPIHSLPGGVFPSAVEGRLVSMTLKSIYSKNHCNCSISRELFRNLEHRTAGKIGQRSGAC